MEKKQRRFSKTGKTEKQTVKADRSSGKQGNDRGKGMLVKRADKADNITKAGGREQRRRRSLDMRQKTAVKASRQKTEQKEAGDAAQVGQQTRKRRNGAENKALPLKNAGKVKKISKVPFAKPGNFLYPVPAVMVSCQDAAGRPNIITLAWAGTVCSDPPMLSVSIRKERYSHGLIKEAGVFVVNLTTQELAWAADYCGVKSGRDVDKYSACGLTVGKSAFVSAPTIQEAPVSLSCRVTQILELGSHDMFLAEVVGVEVDERYLDQKGGFHLEDAGLIAYAHGRYFALGELLGTFGFSVRRKGSR